jgi:ElaB/YqjD/DUF883 family membrane-anchored ribosome-binding protein
MGEELRKLANHPDLAAKSVLLKDLAKAMSDRDKAERWCEVDLFAAFSPAETVIPALPEKASRKHWASRVVKGLLAVGPVLVFGPVLLTWLGLHEATSAYGEVLNAQGVEAAQRPFLEMWQQGFDGRLPSIFKFNNVAMLTLGAIVFLGVWTVGETLLHDRLLDRAERRLIMLRAQLSRVLTEASLYLGQVRMSAPSRFTAELTQAAAQISQVGETVRRAQSDLMDAIVYALEAAQKTGDALISSASEVKDTTQVLDRHFTEINQATVTMSSVVDAMGIRTGESVDELRKDLVTALDSELETLASGIRSSVSELRGGVGELAVAGNDITQAVDRSADSMKAVGTTTEQAMNALTAQLTQVLQLTASDFQRAFTGTSTEIRAALGDWADTAGAHASRIELVTDVSGRTVDMLDRTRSSFERLATLPDQILETAGSTLEEARTTANAELDQLRQSIAQFGQILDEASHTIAAVTRNRQGDGA